MSSTWGRSTLVPTAAANPAETLMFVDRANRADYGDVVFWYGQGTGWIIAGTVDNPYCYNEPEIWCTDGWGLGSWYNGYLQNKESAGAFTGAAAPRASGNMVTSFVDGHAKKMNAGALAAGTNWNKNIQDSAIVITDSSKYIWDLK